MARLPEEIQTAVAIDPNPLPQPTFRDEQHRLSMHPLLRLPIMSAASFTAGFALGMAHGAPIAAYRYRAENAHRLPTSMTGWYLYHKSKNYHSIIGGAKDGVKMGLVVAGTAGLFLSIENVVDQTRGTKDVGSTVVAGAAVSGLWSLVKARDIWTASRMVKTGFKVSLVYGFLQDGIAWARGRPPGYIAWFMNTEKEPW
ncbi:MAG: hypothetical protein Q9227_000233 [Pyrenula ochraceoflavens]